MNVVDKKMPFDMLVDIKKNIDKMESAEDIKRFISRLYDELAKEMHMENYERPCAIIEVTERTVNSAIDTETVSKFMRKEIYETFEYDLTRCWKTLSASFEMAKLREDDKVAKITFNMKGDN